MYLNFSLRINWFGLVILLVWRKGSAISQSDKNEYVNEIKIHLCVPFATGLLFAQRFGAKSWVVMHLVHYVMAILREITKKVN